jgi:hypothetical protein
MGNMLTACTLPQLRFVENCAIRCPLSAAQIEIQPMQQNSACVRQNCCGGAAFRLEIDLQIIYGKLPETATVYIINSAGACL